MQIIPSNAFCIWKPEAEWKMKLPACDPTPSGGDSLTPASFHRHDVSELGTLTINWLGMKGQLNFWSNHLSQRQLTDTFIHQCVLMLFYGSTWGCWLTVLAATKSWRITEQARFKNSLHTCAHQQPATLLANTRNLIILCGSPRASSLLFESLVAPPSGNRLRNLNPAVFLWHFFTDFFTFLVLII